MTGRVVAWAMEILLIVLVLGAPWAFGSVHAPFELWLAYGVGLVIILFGLRCALDGRLYWADGRSSNLVALGFYLLFLVATLQTFPMVESFVSAISPQTTQQLAAFLPVEPERLLDASDPISSPSNWVAGPRLSLNPGGSYQFAVRMLALTGLFLAVSSLGSLPGILLRISVAGAVAGTALALFGLVQYFSSDSKHIYWYFESNGGGFGPFISRNHYPFYANLCLGLTTGLLLDRYGKSRQGWFVTLTQDTWAMWLLAAMVFIMASIIVCVSRGGFVSMALALTVCLSTRLGQGKSIGTLGLAFAILAGAAILLTWVGFDLFASRLSTLVESDQMREDGRWHLWAAALGTIIRFPLLGSGGETFRYWETMLNQNAQWNSAIQAAWRCDNEFLDVWAEYGVVGCAALLIMTLAVLWHGYHWARRDGLAAGAFMAMTAVIAHSCLDFGLRVPASGVLATIVAGLLCSFQGQARHRKPSDRRSNPSLSRSPKADSQSLVYESKKGTSDKSAGQDMASATQSSSAWAAWGMLVVSTIVATHIINEKRRYADAYYWQAAGERALLERDIDNCIQFMNRSAQTVREDINTRLAAARITLLAAGQSNQPSQKQAIVRAGLVHSVIARNLCPLAYEPHLWLAQYVDQLALGDSRLDYLKRAQQLHPSDSDISFALGALLFDEGQFEQAWPYWQRSLTFSSKFLSDVLLRASQHLKGQEIIVQVLPADPQRLAEAATFAQANGQLENSQVFLKHALDLMPSDIQDADKAADNFHLAATLHQRLGQTDQAIEAHRKAITFRPGANPWRLELVRLLIQRERLDEAERELSYVKLYEPENRQAQSLSTTLQQLKKEKKNAPTPLPAKG